MSNMDTKKAYCIYHSTKRTALLGFQSNKEVDPGRNKQKWRLTGD